MSLPLPADTRINVRYGGNPDGEPYGLGDTRTPQAVSCREGIGGAPSDDDDDDDDAARGGAGSTSGSGSATRDDPAVLALRCRLYTQGPARLDVTATGYEPINDLALAFEPKNRCEVLIEVKLVPLKLDGGM